LIITSSTYIRQTVGQEEEALEERKLGEQQRRKERKSSGPLPTVATLLTILVRASQRKLML
jgi:hypothetical protein